MLVSPSIKPNSSYRFLVSPFHVLTRIRVLYHRFHRRFGLLWTIAGEIPLNLMQKACLAKAPITVNAEYLWRGATRDSLADFLNQHLSAEGIQQSRFIIVHGNTFLANLSHQVSETGTAYHVWNGYAATNFRTAILMRRGYWPPCPATRTNRESSRAGSHTSLLAASRHSIVVSLCYPIEPIGPVVVRIVVAHPSDPFLMSEARETRLAVKQPTPLGRKVLDSRAL